MNDLAFASDLDLVVLKTGHKRYRDLCDPAREGWQGVRDFIRRKAGEIRVADPGFPHAGIPIGRIPRDRRLRVGFVVPVLLQGGAEEWHRQLLLNLDPERFVVTGLAVKDGSHVRPQTMALFRDRVPTGSGPAAIQALLDTSEIVVVWAVDLSPYRVPPGTAVVGVSHGDGNSPYSMIATAAVEASVTHWVGVSPSAYVPEGVSHTVLANGADFARIDAKRDAASVREELGFLPTDKVVVYCGRLATEDKRADLLPEVLAHLPERWKLLMIGGGHQSPGILAKCEALIPGRWRHVPWTDTPGDYLIAGEIGLLLSRTESFGLVLAEMTYAGLPIVSTEVGLAKMHPEMFRVMPPDASPELAAWEVEALSKDWDRYDRVERAWDLVDREYSTPAFVRRWQDYLVSIAPPAPELPSLMTMAGNLVATAAAQIAAGNPRLSAAEADARLAICEVCPSRIPDTWRCGGMVGCGCHLTEKAPLATALCPLGKWPEV